MSNPVPMDATDPPDPFESVVPPSVTSGTEITGVRSFQARVMVDGANLHTEVHLPAGDEPVPALLMRTPYGAHDAQRALYAHPSWYARHGFAVVVQDVRGRWSSEGEFEPFRHEAADGEATVSWVSEQPWCDGQVGMYGMSYPGFTQLSAASRGAAALRAIAPAMTGADPWADWMYDGGLLSLSTVPFWAVILAIDGARRAGDLAAIHELQELAGRPELLYERYGTVEDESLLPPAARRHAPFLQTWLAHREPGTYWSNLVPPDVLERVDIPALHVAGWFDVLLGGTLRTYRRLVERAVAPQRLIIGPWAHEPWSAYVGSWDHGADAGNCVDEAQLAWFSHWLQGKPLDMAPVRVFVLGRNRWTDEEAWPPTYATRVRLHLGSNGRANSRSGTGRLVSDPVADEPPDIIVHDPRSPLLSVGGNGCSTNNGSIVGPRDQRQQESRNDLLVYDGAPLSSTLIAAGEVTCDLYVGIEGRNADFVVRLVRVMVDGTAIGLTEGVVRIHEGGLSQASHARVAQLPSGVVRIRMSVGHTYVELQPGERLRLEIAASSFPRYERNWNGHPPHLAPTAFREATTTQRVFHDTRFPSALELPVVGGSARG